MLAACHTSPAAPVQAALLSPTGAATPVSASMPCGTRSLERNTCMIELMLADVRATYDGPDGGGIASIRAQSSTSYTVSLPQEERVDLLTYDFAVSGDAVSITGRTEATESF